MPFIGTQPDVGGYSVLDNLTASATASYTLQKDSANFSPSSANQLLVSLNGVIQKPGSSFTVSGSTLTFSSALTSSDSIDFILAMGEPLLVGTPSDGTVSTSKIADDAVTGAKIENNPEIAGALTTNGNITITSNTLADDGNEGYAVKFRNINSANSSQSATYATISAESEGNWGGDIVFKTKPDNGTPNDTVAEHLRIDHDGHGISKFTAVAWVNCGGTSGANETTINGSYNVSSAVDAESGANYYQYTKQQSTDYKAIVASQNNSGWAADREQVTGENNATQFRVRTFDQSGADDAMHNAIVFGPAVTT